MPTKKIRKELKEANPKEVSYAVFENFFFGLSGAMIVPFIALRMDIAVLIGYMIHYFYISKVINRHIFDPILVEISSFQVFKVFKASRLHL